MRELAFKGDGDTVILSFLTDEQTTESVKDGILAQLRQEYHVSMEWQCLRTRKYNFTITVYRNEETLLGLERFVISHVVNALVQHTRVSNVRAAHDKDAHTARIVFDFN